MTYELVIPDAPKSMNQGGAGYKRHYWLAIKEKQRWMALYDAELMVQRVPKGMTFCSVDITIRWKHRRRRDVANYYAPVTKHLYDSLVRGNWLSDDTDEYVELAGFRFQYPDTWPYKDPRLKSQLVVALTPRY